MSRTGGIEYRANQAYSIWAKSYVKKKSNTIIFGSAGSVLIPVNTEIIEFILQPLAVVKNFIIQANYGSGEILGMNFDGDILSLPGVTDGAGKNLDQKYPVMAFTKMSVVASTALTFTGFIGIMEIDPNV